MTTETQAPDPAPPLADGFEGWWAANRIKRVLNPAGVARMVWEASARYNRMIFGGSSTPMQTAQPLGDMERDGLTSHAAPPQQAIPAPEGALRNIAETCEWNAAAPGTDDEKARWARVAAFARAALAAQSGDELQEWSGATPFLRHVQSAAGIDRPDWGDEFLAWYKPGDWLGEHRGAAVWLGQRIGLLNDVAETLRGQLADLQALCDERGRKLYGEDGEAPAEAHGDERAALERLAKAVEYELDPDWECNSYHPSLAPALKHARAVLDARPNVQPKGTDERAVCEILASIWFYGQWVAETANERELESLMRRLSLWPTTEGDIMKRSLAREAQAPAPAHAVPAGFALVPVEPTPEMIHAIRFAGDPDRPAIGERIVIGETAFPFVGGDVALHMYRTMLATAPATPSPELDHEPRCRSLRPR